MSKSEFFTNAVAEAKTIKATAFENAKLAMAESFAPTVKNMLSSQLNEMEEELDENLEEEVTLEELLNSLEEGDDYGTNMVTGKPLPKPDPIVENDDELPEFEGEEIEVDEFNPELSDEGGELLGDEEVGEITVDDLRDIIRDVMQELDGPTEDETFDEPIEDEVIEDEEELNIDEILGDDNLEEMSSEPIDGSSSAGAGLDNIITQIKSLVAKSPEFLNQIAGFIKDLPSGAGAAMRAESTQLAEAKKVIASQSSTLKEVNLLNSKLLNVNKLFKAHNLSENQKIKVVNAIDRAKTVSESDNIFLTLKESFINSTNTGRSLHENRGRASKPAGVAQKPNQQILTEDVDFVARMQKLAGIK